MRSSEFARCNGQLSLEAHVREDDTLLAQVGTSESLVGSLVIRVELRDSSGGSRSSGKHLLSR